MNPLIQIRQFDIILVMNTWYKKVRLLILTGAHLLCCRIGKYGCLVYTFLYCKKMKRIIGINPASFIKSLRDLMSGPFRRENANAFSRLKERSRFRLTYRVIALFVSLVFGINFIIPPVKGYAQVSSNLPVPGIMVSVSPSFVPVMLKGVTIYPEHPLKFDFIVDQGQAKLGKEELKEESEKLIKYFLASLTTPEQDLWVNLSPYEEERVIQESFGVTTMGRDLLSQDYILKQLMASLTYPESGLGKEFWNRVYARAYELYGTTDLPFNTFNKVWVVPDKAEVYEKEGTAFIVDSHLKVMMEEDYLALGKNVSNKEVGTQGFAEEEVKAISKVSSEIAKEVLLPEIEKEVNKGKNFALLRQVYQSLILATWYKQRFMVGTGRDLSLLGQIYVDKGKIKGVEVEDKEIKDKIYEQYIEAFREGVYEMIKEDYDEYEQEVIPRKYFSGGVDGREVGEITEIKTDYALLSDSGKADILEVRQSIDDEDFRVSIVTTEVAEPGEFISTDTDASYGDNRLLTREDPIEAGISLRSRKNSLSDLGEEETSPRTERFSARKRSSGRDIEYNVKNTIPFESLSELETIASDEFAETFAIYGESKKEAGKLRKALQKSPQILKKALILSESFHGGEVDKEIKVVLADKYDVIAGADRDYNVIVLNATDLEEMIKENAFFAEIFITALLTKALSYLRGADRDLGIEVKLAQEFFSPMNFYMRGEFLTGYVSFVEKYSQEMEEGTGYLGYLKEALKLKDDMEELEELSHELSDREIELAKKESEEGRKEKEEYEAEFKEGYEDVQRKIKANPEMFLEVAETEEALSFCETHELTEDWEMMELYREAMKEKGKKAIEIFKKISDYQDKHKEITREEWEWLYEQIARFPMTMRKIMNLSPYEKEWQAIEDMVQNYEENMFQRSVLIERFTKDMPRIVELLAKGTARQATAEDWEELLLLAGSSSEYVNDNIGLLLGPYSEQWNAIRGIVPNKLELGELSERIVAIVDVLERIANSEKIATEDLEWLFDEAEKDSSLVGNIGILTQHSEYSRKVIEMGDEKNTLRGARKYTDKEGLIEALANRMQKVKSSVDRGEPSAVDLSLLEGEEEDVNKEKFTFIFKEISGFFGKQNAQVRGRVEAFCQVVEEVLKVPEGIPVDYELEHKIDSFYDQWQVDKKDIKEKLQARDTSSDIMTPSNKEGEEYRRISEDMMVLYRLIKEYIGLKEKNKLESIPLHRPGAVAVIRRLRKMSEFIIPMMVMRTEGISPEGILLHLNEIYGELWYRQKKAELEKAGRFSEEDSRHLLTKLVNANIFSYEYAMIFKESEERDGLSEFNAEYIKEHPLFERPEMPEEDEEEIAAEEKKPKADSIEVLNMVAETVLGDIINWIRRHKVLTATAVIVPLVGMGVADLILHYGGDDLGGDALSDDGTLLAQGRTAMSYFDYVESGIDIGEGIIGVKYAKGVSPAILISEMMDDVGRKMEKSTLEDGWEGFDQNQIPKVGSGKEEDPEGTIVTPEAYEAEKRLEALSRENEQLRRLEEERIKQLAEKKTDEEKEKTPEEKKMTVQEEWSDVVSKLQKRLDAFKIRLGERFAEEGFQEKIKQLGFSEVDQKKFREAVNDPRFDAEILLAALSSVFGHNLNDPNIQAILKEAHAYGLPIIVIDAWSEEGERGYQAETVREAGVGIRLNAPLLTTSEEFISVFMRELFRALLQYEESQGPLSRGDSLKALSAGIAELLSQLALSTEGLGIDSYDKDFEGEVFLSKILMELNEGILFDYYRGEDRGGIRADELFKRLGTEFFPGMSPEDVKRLTEYLSQKDVYDSGELTQLLSNYLKMGNKAETLIREMKRPQLVYQVLFALKFFEAGIIDRDVAEDILENIVVKGVNASTNEVTKEYIKQLMDLLYPLDETTSEKDESLKERKRLAEDLQKKGLLSLDEAKQWQSYPEDKQELPLPDKKEPEEKEEKKEEKEKEEKPDKEKEETKKPKKDSLADEMEKQGEKPTKKRTKNWGSGRTPASMNGGHSSTPEWVTEDGVGSLFRMQVAEEYDDGGMIHKAVKKDDPGVGVFQEKVRGTKWTAGTQNIEFAPIPVATGQGRAPDIDSVVVYKFGTKERVEGAKIYVDQNGVYYLRIPNIKGEMDIKFKVGKYESPTKYNGPPVDPNHPTRQKIYTGRLSDDTEVALAMAEKESDINKQVAIIDKHIKGTSDYTTDPEFSAKHHAHDEGFIHGVDKTKDEQDYRKMDCDVSGVYGIALLRRLGIPARMVYGFSGYRMLSMRHAYVEYWDGKQWKATDFTPGNIDGEDTGLEERTNDWAERMLDEFKDSREEEEKPQWPEEPQEPEEPEEPQEPEEETLDEFAEFLKDLQDPNYRYAVSRAELERLVQTPDQVRQLMETLANINERVNENYGEFFRHKIFNTFQNGTSLDYSAEDVIQLLAIFNLIGLPVTKDFMNELSGELQNIPVEFYGNKYGDFLDALRGIPSREKENELHEQEKVKLSLILRRPRHETREFIIYLEDSIEQGKITEQLRRFMGLDTTVGSEARLLDIVYQLVSRFLDGGDFSEQDIIRLTRVVGKAFRYLNENRIPQAIRDNFVKNKEEIIKGYFQYITDFPSSLDESAYAVFLDYFQEIKREIPSHMVKDTYGRYLNSMLQSTAGIKRLINELDLDLGDSNIDPGIIKMTFDNLVDKLLQEKKSNEFDAIDITRVTKIMTEYPFESEDIQDEKINEFLKWLEDTPNSFADNEYEQFMDALAKLKEKVDLTQMDNYRPLLKRLLATSRGAKRMIKELEEVFDKTLIIASEGVFNSMVDLEVLAEIFFVHVQAGDLKFDDLTRFTEIFQNAYGRYIGVNQMEKMYKGKPGYEFLTPVSMQIFNAAYENAVRLYLKDVINLPQDFYQGQYKTFFDLLQKAIIGFMAYESFDFPHEDIVPEKINKELLNDILLYLALSEDYLNEGNIANWTRFSTVFKDLKEAERTVIPKLIIFSELVAEYVTIPEAFDAVLMRALKVNGRRHYSGFEDDGYKVAIKEVIKLEGNVKKLLEKYPQLEDGRYKYSALVAKIVERLKGRLGFNYDHLGDITRHIIEEGQKGLHDPKTGLTVLPRNKQDIENLLELARYTEEPERRFSLVVLALGSTVIRGSEVSISLFDELFKPESLFSKLTFSRKKDATSWTGLLGRLRGDYGALRRKFINPFEKIDTQTLLRNLEKMLQGRDISESSIVVKILEQLYPHFKGDTQKCSQELQKQRQRNMQNEEDVINHLVNEALHGDFYMSDIQELIDLKAEERAINKLKKVVLDGTQEEKLRSRAINLLREFGSQLALKALQEAFPEVTDLGDRKHILYALGCMKDSSAVPMLKEVLVDESSGCRLEAAVALALLGDSSAVDVLKEFLKDNDDSKRRSAVHHLSGMYRSEIKDPSIIPDLIRMLKEDESVKVRDSVVDALAYLGVVSAIEDLKAILGDKTEDTSLRSSVAKALGNIGSSSTEGYVAIDSAVSTLERVFLDKSEKPRLQKQAEIALVRIGSTRTLRILEEQLFKGKDVVESLQDYAEPALVMPIFKKVLNTPTVSKKIKEKARIALAQLGDEESIRILIDEFHKEEEEYSRQDKGSEVRRALWRIEDKSYLPFLIEILSDEKQKEVHSGAVEALGNIKDPSVIPLLVEIVTKEDAEPRARSECVISLMKIGTPEAIEIVKQLLVESKFSNVRYSAARHLDEEEYPNVIPFLREALKDEDFDVRQAAAQSLAGLGDESALYKIRDPVPSSDRDIFDIYDFSSWVEEEVEYINLADRVGILNNAVLKEIAEPFSQIGDYTYHEMYAEGITKVLDTIRNVPGSDSAKRKEMAYVFASEILQGSHFRADENIFILEWLLAHMGDELKQKDEFWATLEDKIIAENKDMEDYFEYRGNIRKILRVFSSYPEVGEKGVKLCLRLLSQSKFRVDTNETLIEWLQENINEEAGNDQEIWREFRTRAVKDIVRIKDGEEYKKGVTEILKIFEQYPQQKSTTGAGLCIDLLLRSKFGFEENQFLVEWVGENAKENPQGVKREMVIQLNQIARDFEAHYQMKPILPCLSGKNWLTSLVEKELISDFTSKYVLNEESKRQAVGYMIRINNRLGKIMSLIPETQITSKEVPTATWTAGELAQETLGQMIRKPIDWIIFLGLMASWIVALKTEAEYRSVRKETKEIAEEVLTEIVNSAKEDEVASDVFWEKIGDRFIDKLRTDVDMLENKRLEEFLEKFEEASDNERKLFTLLLLGFGREDVLLSSENLLRTIVHNTPVGMFKKYGRAIRGKEKTKQMLERQELWQEAKERLEDSHLMADNMPVALFFDTLVDLFSGIEDESEQERGLPGWARTWQGGNPAVEALGKKFEEALKKMSPDRGGEFKEHKRYVAGDDIRDLDWKVLGKTDKLYIKQKESKESIPVIIGVDVSTSMTVDRDKLKKTAEAAYLLGEVAKANGNEVGYVLFSDDVVRYFPAKGSGATLPALQEILNMPKEGAGKTSITKLLAYLSGIRRDALGKRVFCLVSDFADSGFEQDLKAFVANNKTLGINVASEGEVMGNLQRVFDNERDVARKEMFRGKYVTVRPEDKADQSINQLLGGSSPARSRLSNGSQRTMINNSSNTLTQGDSAMMSDVGGIDFNPAHLNLQIKRDGKGVPLPVHQQDIENIQIEGLTPVIINITPATYQHLPFLSRESEEESEGQLSYLR